MNALIFFIIAPKKNMSVSGKKRQEKIKNVTMYALIFFHDCPKKIMSVSGKKDRRK